MNTSRTMRQATATLITTFAESYKDSAQQSVRERRNNHRVETMAAIADYVSDNDESTRNAADELASNWNLQF